MVQPEWLRLQTAAARFDCSVDTLRRLIRKGALPARRFGSQSLRVRVADLEALLTPAGAS